MNNYVIAKLDTRLHLYKVVSFEDETLKYSPIPICGNQKVKLLDNHKVSSYSSEIEVINMIENTLTGLESYDLCAGCVQQIFINRRDYYKTVWEKINKNKFYAKEDFNNQDYETSINALIKKHFK